MIKMEIVWWSARDLFSRMYIWMLKKHFAGKFDFQSDIIDVDSNYVCAAFLIRTAFVLHHVKLKMS